MKKWEAQELNANPVDMEKFYGAMKTLRENMDVFNGYVGSENAIPALGLVSSGDDFCIQVYVKSERIDELKDIIPDKIGDCDVYYVEAEKHFKDRGEYDE